MDAGIELKIQLKISAIVSQSTPADMERVAAALPRMVTTYVQMYIVTQQSMQCNDLVEF